MAGEMILCIFRHGDWMRTLKIFSAKLFAAPPVDGVWF
jgi:hypothetical protein